MYVLLVLDDLLLDDDHLALRYDELLYEFRWRTRHHKFSRQHVQDVQIQADVLKLMRRFAR